MKINYSILKSIQEKDGMKTIRRNLLSHIDYDKQHDTHLHYDKKMKISEVKFLFEHDEQWAQRWRHEEELFHAKQVFIFSFGRSF